MANHAARLRSPRQRHAFGFVVGMLIAASGLHGILVYTARHKTWLIDPKYSNTIDKLRERLDTSLSERPPVVCVIGSSRSAFGLRGEIVEKTLREQGTDVIAFNLSMTGAGPLLHLVLLERMIRDGCRPDFLLLEFSPAFYAGRTDKAVDRQWADPKRLTDDERRRVAPYSTLPSDARIPLLEEWYAHRNRLVFRFRESWLPLPYRDEDLKHLGRWGQAVVLTSSEVRPRTPEWLDKAKKEYFQAIQNLAFEGRPRQTLRAILDLCRSEGISAALLLTPEGEEFRSWYPPEIRKRLPEMVAQVAAEEQLPLFDAWTWMGDDDFFDSHHLLDHGARRYSARLAHECLSPWLQRSSGARTPFLTTSRPR